MANPYMPKLEYLQNENNKHLQQDDDLKDIVLKFSNGRKMLDLLLNNQSLLKVVGFTKNNDSSSQKSD